jgi:DNA polymerase-3 subunit delta'
MALSSGEAFALLQKAKQHDRLAHGCLITGPPGSGKRALASQLAGLIVEQAKGDPLKHQDVHTIQPESKSRRILIDQIRGLEDELRMRSMTGGAKVGIIFDAERLQPQAANAFLKTLEEPPGRSHLILISALPDQLLETIISRCMEVALRPLHAPERTPRQLALLEVLAASHRRAGVDLPQVYGLVRDFQKLLSESKEAAQEQAEADFKLEEQRYKQMADARWLEEREEQFKAIAEARYVAERSILLETLELWWADILRQQAGAAQVEFASHAAATSALAATLTPAAALRRSAAIEQLREQLGNPGLQEQLAIEVAFARSFGQE